jgi:hypothetical protein
MHSHTAIAPSGVWLDEMPGPCKDNYALRLNMPMKELLNPCCCSSERRLIAGWGKQFTRSAGYILQESIHREKIIQWQPFQTDNPDIIIMTE